jgi:hypothetical protein
MRRQAVLHGRAKQERLVEQHGIDRVEGWLADIKAKRPTRRKRGRPPGAKYDDTRLLREAAENWRQAGRGTVWPSLLDVGGGESAARRLLHRLDEWNDDGCAERGIADLYAGLCRCRDERAAAKFVAKVAMSVMGELAMVGFITTQGAHELTAPFIDEIADGLRHGEEVRLGFGVFYPTPNGGVGFRPASKLKAAAARRLRACS